MAVINLDESSRIALIKYLVKHEWDIAMGRRDYGSLMGVFIELIGREPLEE